MRLYALAKSEAPLYLPRMRVHTSFRSVRLPCWGWVMYLHGHLVFCGACKFLQEDESDRRAKAETLVQQVRVSSS